MKKIAVAVKLAVLGCRIERLNSAIGKHYSKYGTLTDPKILAANTKLSKLRIRFAQLEKKYKGEKDD
jgi:hypothetical protein